MWRLLLAPWAALPGLPIWLLFVLPAWALGFLKLRGVRQCAFLFRVNLLRGGSLGRAWVRRWSGWGGLSLPFCAMVTTGSHRLISHEIRHCDQWLWMGPLFPVVYLVLLLHYGYERHPLERDARRAAERSS